jgi:hypothetical protein
MFFIKKVTILCNATKNFRAFKQICHLNAQLLILFKRFQSTMDRAHELLKQADDMMLKSIEHMAKLEKMVGFLIRALF